MILEKCCSQKASQALVKQKSNTPEWFGRKLTSLKKRQRQFPIVENRSATATLFVGGRPRAMFAVKNLAGARRAWTNLNWHATYWEEYTSVLGVNLERVFNPMSKSRAASRENPMSEYSQAWEEASWSWMASNQVRSQDEPVRRSLKGDHLMRRR